MAIFDLAPMAGGSSAGIVVDQGTRVTEDPQDIPQRASARTHDHIRIAKPAVHVNVAAQEFRIGEVENHVVSGCAKSLTGRNDSGP